MLVNSPEVPQGAVVRSRRPSTVRIDNRLGSDTDDPPRHELPPEDPKSYRYRLKLQAEVERDTTAATDRDQQRDYELRKLELEIERIRVETDPTTARRLASTAAAAPPALSAPSALPGHNAVVFI
ncbi:hypothetical protein FRC08_004595 [Ceratobasidium sp. 394]|nr:hypothetical protein FRC08_004595 [Ceratobasidium sp. 394]